MPSNTVKATLVADDTRFRAGFKGAEDAADSFGKKAAGTAKVIAAALAVAAVAAVTQFAADSLRAFSELNESLNALEVSYGEHAEGIKSLGEEAAQSIGASNSEFNGYAVSISAFAKQIAGDGGDVTRTVDTLSKRTADFASVMNLDFGEASEKFRSGLAGESEPLRQFGIDVSAAKVEAFALANGIAKAGEEMTEAQKVQARYGTIMEQTANVQGDFARTADDAANKQRILDAELENNKALLGQAILPLQQTWQQIQADTIPIIADLALELGRYTGALTDAEAALLKFKTEEGHAVETSDELLASISSLGSGSPLADLVAGWFDMTKKTEDWVDAMKEGIETAGLSEEELYRLGLALEGLHEAGDLTDEQLQELNATLDIQKYRQEQLARPISDNEQALYALEQAEENLGEATNLTTEELKAQADQLRAQTDPLYAVYTASQEVTRAQEAYTEALRLSGPGSDEAIAAAWELTRAEQALDEALIAVKTSGMTQQQFLDWQMGMGRSAQEAQNLADQLARIEGFAWPDPEVTLQVNVPTFSWVTDARDVRPRRTGHVALAEGGIATDPTFAEIGEGAGDEAIIPLDQRGIRILAAALAEAMAMAPVATGSGDPIVINIHNAGSVVTVRDLVDEIHEGLLRKQQRTGRLGFK